MLHRLTIKLDQQRVGPIQLDGKDILCESLVISLNADKMPTATIKVPLSGIDIDIEKCDVVIEKDALKKSDENA